MALITTQILVQTVGIAWQMLLKQWEAWLPDDTTTLSAGAVAADNFASVKTCFIQRVGAVDTDRIVYGMMDITSASLQVPFQYVINSPGWGYMPPYLQQNYGSRSTLTNFQTVPRAARIALWNEVCGFAGATYTSASQTTLNFTTLLYRALILKAWQGYGDTLVLGYYNTSATLTVQGNQIQGNGNAASPTYPNISAGGGDNTAIVQALRDIANQEVQTSINNGGVTVLQKSGDIVYLP